MATELDAALVILRKHRNHIERTIQSLEALGIVVPSPRRRARGQTERVTLRQETLIAWLRANNGNGTPTQLFAAMPYESNLTAVKSKEVFNNAVMNLRMRGQIVRIGGVWSLVQQI